MERARVEEEGRRRRERGVSVSRERRDCIDEVHCRAQRSGTTHKVGGRRVKGERRAAARDRQTGSRTRSERERGAREGGERERLGLGGRAHARKSSERSTCQPADGKGCASVRLPHLPCACRLRAARTHKVQGITGGATGQAAGKEGKPGRPKKRRASLRAAGFPVFFCRDPVSPDSPDPTASLATHQELISSAFSDEEACAHGRRSGTVCARTPTSLHNRDGCTTGETEARSHIGGRAQAPRAAKQSLVLPGPLGPLILLHRVGRRRRLRTCPDAPIPIIVQPRVPIQHKVLQHEEQVEPEREEAQAAARARQRCA